MCSDSSKSAHLSYRVICSFRLQEWPILPGNGVDLGAIEATLKTPRAIMIDHAYDLASMPYRIRQSPRHDLKWTLNT